VVVARNRNDRINSVVRARRCQSGDSTALDTLPRDEPESCIRMCQLCASSRIVLPPSPPPFRSSRSCAGVAIDASSPSTERARASANETPRARSLIFRPSGARLEMDGREPMTFTCRDECRENIPIFIAAHLRRERGANRARSHAFTVGRTKSVAVIARDL